MISTGNNTVDQLTNVQFTGNIIHNQWFRTIKTANGKPDSISIFLLADIVYWYRPVEVRDEHTGQSIGWRKKFAADMLQRSYDSFAEATGYTREQVRDSIIRLEKKGIIKRVFRNIRVGNTTHSNVMFIDLDFTALCNVSFAGKPNKIKGLNGVSGEFSPHPPRKNPGTLPGNFPIRIHRVPTQTSSQTTTPAVVHVDNSESEYQELINQLATFGISPTAGRNLIKRSGDTDAVWYQLHHLRDAFSAGQNIPNPGGWIRTAIKQQWSNRYAEAIVKREEQRSIAEATAEQARHALEQIAAGDQAAAAGVDDPEFRNKLLKSEFWKERAKFG
ncbi:hypothetical protein SDC9_15015 [bioreactor metagenome]|uniref:Uncharacterized protein n=1 Tax=bioreactor metagenome TaxID=1076179 RepID=A0A644TQJ7_9ZZZZ